MSPTMFGAPVSVIILTYNEEANIRHCLESVKFLSAEIFVVDSFSTDKTLEIAREYTDKIYQNPWIDFAAQRNWAMNNLPVTNDWVLFLDADERLTLELRQEIVDILLNTDKHIDGYYIKRNFYFLGRWLRHGGYANDFILRLIKKNNSSVLGIGIWEYMTVKGNVERLKNPMFHEDKRGVTSWINKHNNYARLEAQEAMKIDTGPGLNEKIDAPENLKIEHGHKIWLRQRIWKNLPIFFRPFIYFTYRYIWQLGLLDGKEGFIYCFLHAFWYPFLVDTKYLELKKLRESKSL